MTAGHVADWRRFQDLVARIQQVIHGSGATVESPAYLKDLQTGGRREVDAAIRKEVAGKPTLITVETRKHKDAQDVTWIEQLSTKRRKVGADLTIAVSGSGFAKEAVMTAEAEGILVRTLEELARSNLRWLALAFAEEVVKTFRFLDFKIDLWEPAREAGTLRLDPDRMGQLGVFGYPLLTRERDGSLFSLESVVEIAKSQGFDPFEGCGVGETSPKRVLPYELQDKGIGLYVGDTFRPVRSIKILYQVSIEARPMPVSSAYRFTAPNNTELVEGVELSLPSFDGVTLNIQKDVGQGGKYSAALARMPPAKPKAKRRRARL